MFVYHVSYISFFFPLFASSEYFLLHILSVLLLISLSLYVHCRVNQAYVKVLKRVSYLYQLDSNDLEKLCSCAVLINFCSIVVCFYI